VIAKMLERQIEQEYGNSLENLQNDNGHSRGFKWKKAIEGHTFWSEVIIYKNFDLFFEKYPKNKIYELW
jgi:hypothetical protein